MFNLNGKIKKCRKEKEKNPKRREKKRQKFCFGCGLVARSTVKNVLWFTKIYD